MPAAQIRLIGLITLAAAWAGPASASVKIQSFSPSLPGPRVIGAAITWTVTAMDTQAGPLTFQFNVAPPGGSFAVVKDFNVGINLLGNWQAQPFVWVPTGIDGPYQIQVVAKDFSSGAEDSRTENYAVSPLVTGSNPVVAATSNPLVALFSAPSCPAGSIMRVSFQQRTGSTATTTTNYRPCNPPYTMTFEIAGMYPSTIYSMFAQTNTGGAIKNGPTITFTTGILPKLVPLPNFTVQIAAGPHTDTTDAIILQNVSSFSLSSSLANVATDLSGKILWYYSPGQAIYLARLLPNATMLTIQSGASWSPLSPELQLLQQIDLAGNIIKETNLGILSQQLVAMGAADAQMCNKIISPAPIGFGCLNTLHHDAIQTLPNGRTAVFAAVEKILPAGTQGDATGLPVDVIGDMIIVLDANWQVVWYFDSFQHDTGAPQLEINRRAVLGESCTAPQSSGCPPLFLAGRGIAPQAKDWLHGNSLYYWPQEGDIIWSSRNQDWIMKIDYRNGIGTGNILWRLGPCGDFTFNNIGNDPWPWNSHQHDFGIENNGAGLATLFDNGNTRYSRPGVSTGCMQSVGSGHSRGMALNIDESTMTVTPVLSDDLGAQALGDGSAQLLSNRSYAFVASDVALGLNTVSYVLEILPAAGTLTGSQVLKILAPNDYRIWRMPSLYDPPTT